MAYNPAKGGFPSLAMYPEWYQRMLAQQAPQSSQMPQFMQSSAPDMSQPQEMSWELGSGVKMPKALTGNPSKLPTVQADPNATPADAPAQKPHYLNFFGRLGDAIFGDNAYANKQAMIEAQALQAQKDAAAQASLAQQRAALKNAGYSDVQIAAIQNDPSGKILQGYIEQNKPLRFANKAGDQIEVAQDGTQKTLYTDTTPDIVPVQGMGVYPTDRHTGKPYSPAPPGFTNLTPDEINKLGLPMSGPGPSAPTGSPLGGGAPMAPSQTISQADFMRLRQSMGAQAAQDYVRTHNIAIGN